MFIASLLLAVQVAARCDFAIDVVEVSRNTTARSCVTFGKTAVTPVANAGPPFTPITDYSIVGDRLQGRSGYIGDAVVSNPLRLLAALAGHPVQVSEINAFALRDGRVISRWRLVRRASSYEWRAVVRHG